MTVSSFPYPPLPAGPCCSSALCYSHPTSLSLSETAVLLLPLLLLLFLLRGTTAVLGTCKTVLEDPKRVEEKLTTGKKKKYSYGFSLYL